MGCGVCGSFRWLWCPSILSYTCEYQARDLTLFLTMGIVELLLHLLRTLQAVSLKIS